MATYLILNVLVIGLVITVARLLTPEVFARKNLVITLLILCLITAVFDSLIIASGIVAYADKLILGIRIGVAPIEDFAYAIVAGLLVPAIFEKLGSRHE